MPYAKARILTRPLHLGRPDKRNETIIDYERNYEFRDCHQPHQPYFRVHSSSPTQHPASCPATGAAPGCPRAGHSPKIWQTQPPQALSEFGSTEPNTQERTTNWRRPQPEHFTFAAAAGC